MGLRINHVPIIMMAATLCLRLLALSAVADPIGILNSPETATEASVDVSDTNEPVPQLLLDIYECWSSGSQDCLADPDVNVVRSLFGQFESSPPQAVQSYNHNTELRNDIAITFNSSIFAQETLYMAALRVYRKALPQEKIDSLQSQCDLSNLKILLYSTQPQVDDDKDIVVLENDMPVSVDSLAEDEWLSFRNVTRILKNRSSNSFLRLRLTMGGSCSDVSPSEFGLSFSQSGYLPELITFAISESDDSFGTQIMEEFQRKKREAIEMGSGDSNSTKEIETKKPTTLEELQLAKCKIHDFNVSFAAIDFDRHIIRPASYNARICAGRCEWPLDQSDNYTKHSYIQSILNFKNPNLIPPPCCAPLPSTMGRLAVVVKDADNSYSTRWWDNMIARSCGCL